MEVTRRRGRRRTKLLDDVKDRRGYSHLKEEALDRTMWRNRFRGGFGPVVRQNTEWMNEYSRLSIFTLPNFTPTQCLKIKINNSNILHMGTEFVPCGECKGNETEVAEEYCWAIAQGAEKSCCGRSGAVCRSLNFKWTLWCVYVCVCVCVRVRARACPRACVCARAMCVYIYIYMHIVDRL